MLLPSTYAGAVPSAASRRCTSSLCVFDGLVRVVQRAAREAPAVVGHDGVVVDEMVGDEVEALGIAHSAGDQEQDGARAAHLRAAHLVVEARSRHAQRVDLRCLHLIGHVGFRGYALALGRAPSPVA